MSVIKYLLRYLLSFTQEKFRYSVIAIEKEKVSLFVIQNPSSH